MSVILSLVIHESLVTQSEHERLMKDFLVDFYLLKAIFYAEVIYTCILKITKNTFVSYLSETIQFE